MAKPQCDTPLVLLVQIVTGLHCTQFGNAQFQYVYFCIPISEEEPLECTGFAIVCVCLSTFQWVAFCNNSKELQSHNLGTFIVADFNLSGG